MGNLRRICETCFAHERRNAVSEVLSQALASMLEASDKTVGSHLRSSKVNQVQRASGFEYPPCLLQCLLLLVGFEVVKHKGGEHLVKRRIRIRKVLSKPAIQLHGERFSLCFTSGVGKRLRVGIEPNNLGLRMKTLDEDREVSSTAADLDGTMVRPDDSLIDQLSVDRLKAQQLLKWIVKRKQPVVPHPREVSLSRLFHGRASTLFCLGILGVVSHEPHLSC